MRNPRTFTPQQEAQAIAMYRNGLSYLRIGEELGCGNMTVYRLLQRMGVELCANRPRKPAKTVKENRNCLRCGTAFFSSGPGNRLCHKCRRIDVSPYAI